MSVHSFDDVSRLDGSWVYARLSPSDQQTFAREFDFALRGARITYEVEPLAAVVREWWLVARGEPDVAQADELRSRRDASLTRSPHPPQQDPTRWVDRTGPAVFAALDRDDRVRFELDFEGAAEMAAASRDQRPLLSVVHDWWTAAWRNANPEHQEIDADVVRRIASGDTSMLVSDDGQ